MANLEYFYKKHCIPIGTAVSAKFRGAFCEANVDRVDKHIKCVVQLNDKKTIKINIEDVIGDLCINSKAKFKVHQNIQSGVLIKLIDDSIYHVVFNDDDTGKLKRNQLVLKGDRHFKESESLDKHPLTNPEQFIKAVVADKSSKDKSDVEDEEYEIDDQKSCSQESLITVSSSKTRNRQHTHTSSPSVGTAGSSVTVKNTETVQKTPLKNIKSKRGHNTKYTIGSIVIVRKIICQCGTTSSGDKPNKKLKPFVGLIVSPSSIDKSYTELKELQVIVRSFQNDKWYVVSKRELEIIKERETLIKSKEIEVSSGTYMDNCMLYIDTKILPSDWNTQRLLNRDRVEEESAQKYMSPTKAKLRSSLCNSRSSLASSNVSEDEDDRNQTSSSMYVHSHEKELFEVDQDARDEWVARFYGFWEDKGSPINNELEMEGIDVDIYRLFDLVSEYGGYQKVSSTYRWPYIYHQLSLPNGSSDRYQRLQFLFKKYIFPYVDMSKKLGTFEQGRNKRGGERENPTFKRARQQLCAKSRDSSSLNKTSSCHSEVGGGNKKKGIMDEDKLDDAGTTVSSTAGSEPPGSSIGGGNLVLSAPDLPASETTLETAHVTASGGTVIVAEEIPVSSRGGPDARSFSCSSPPTSSPRTRSHSTGSSSSSRSGSSNMSSSSGSRSRKRLVPLSTEVAAASTTGGRQDEPQASTEVEVASSSPQRSVSQSSSIARAGPVAPLLPGTVVHVSYGNNKIYKAKVVHIHTPEKQSGSGSGSKRQSQPRTPSVDTASLTADSSVHSGDQQHDQQQHSIPGGVITTYYKVHYVGWNNRHDEIVPAERILEVLSDTGQDNASSCSSSTPRPPTIATTAPLTLDLSHVESVAVTAPSVSPSPTAALASPTPRLPQPAGPIPTEVAVTEESPVKEHSQLHSSSKNDSVDTDLSESSKLFIVEFETEQLSPDKEVKTEIAEDVKESDLITPEEPREIKVKVGLKRRRSKSASHSDEHQAVKKPFPESRMISSLNLKTVDEKQIVPVYIPTPVVVAAVRLAQKRSSNEDETESHTAKKIRLSSASPSIADEDEEEMEDEDNLSETSGTASTVSFRRAELEHMFYLLQSAGESDGSSRQQNSRRRHSRQQQIHKTVSSSTGSGSRVRRREPAGAEADSTSSQHSDSHQHSTGSKQHSRRVTRSLRQITSDQTNQEESSMVLDYDSQTSQEDTGGGGSNREFQLPTSGMVPLATGTPTAKGARYQQQMRVQAAAVASVSGSSRPHRLSISGGVGGRKTRNSLSTTSSTDNNAEAPSTDTDLPASSTGQPAPVLLAAGSVGGVDHPRHQFQRLHPSLVPDDLDSLPPFQRVQKLEALIRQTHLNFLDTKDKLRYVDRRLLEIKACRANGHCVESDEDKFR